MDQRYDFEERKKRIERRLRVGAISSISLGVVVGLITFTVMYKSTVFSTILVASSAAIAATAHLVYRAMDEVEDEDFPALIREKALYVVFAIITGYIVITYLLRL